MKKRICSLLTLLFVVISLFSFNVAAADSDIRVFVDSAEVWFDVKPQIIEGRTMVPIRAIFETMGASVNWDEASRTAICYKDGTTVNMTVDSTWMYVNGEAVSMDVAPTIIDGRTLAPARYVAESFGADVQWDAASKSVIINSYAPYYESTVTMYALDGRTLEVLSSEVEAHQNVGWYLEPMVEMYAADGRTLIVAKREEEAHRNVGWFSTRAEARAAASAPVYSGGASSSGSYNSGDNNSGGAVIYRTPSGKKYHFDPNCGGKNSYQVSLAGAKGAGLTPCSKCAQ